MSQAICDALGCQRTTLRAAYNKVAEQGNGDLGDAAEEVGLKLKNQTTLFGSVRKIKPLMVQDVVASLVTSQTLTGSGSRLARLSNITSLLRRCDANSKKVSSTTRPELRFIVRTCICNLRIHSSMITILSAVARASAMLTGTMTLSKAEVLVREKFALFQDLKTLVNIISTEGVNGLHRLTLSPMTAVDPMLAKPATSIAKVLNCGAGCNLLLEYKYDGVRAQIHVQRKTDGTIPSSSDLKFQYTTKCFSRHLADVTEKYQDAVEYLLSSLNSSVCDLIVDAEIVYVQGDGDSRRIQAFQKLTSRGDSTATGNVCVVLFDVLLHNNISCLDLSLAERRDVLKQIIIECPGKCELAEGVTIFVPDTVSDNSSLHNVVDATLKRAVSAGCEGLMVKMLTPRGTAPMVTRKKRFVETIEEDDFGFPVTKRSIIMVEDNDNVMKVSATFTSASASSTSSTSSSSTSSSSTSSSSPSKKQRKVAMVMLSPTYKVGKRSDAWRKLKIDYIDGAGVCDSIDVVPIGGWRGSGRKSKWYSPILVAVYNPIDDTYESLCRVMSGFSDVEYARIKKDMTIVETKPTNIITNEEPTFWFQQNEVWEIRGADISESPVHCAGIGQHRGDECDESRGLSLRFPRFRARRIDKGIRNATTSVQMVEMFLQQRT